MATPGEAGSVSVKVLPDPSKALWEEQLDAFAATLSVSVKVNLKLAPKAVSALVTETQVAFDKRKALPKLPVKFKIAKGAVTEIVTTTQTAFDKRKALPRLPVKLKLVKGAVAAAAKDAEAQLLAAKTAQPTIKVNLDLDADELKLIKETRVKVREVDAALSAAGVKIDIPVDLDEKSLNEVAKKALIAYNAANESIRAAHEKRLNGLELLEDEARKRRRGNIQADLDFEDELRARAINAGKDKELLAEESQNRRLFEREQDHQNKLNNLLRNNLDARSMEELKQINKIALLHERAELAKQGSSITTLRRLRNDLSQFDQTTTRFLRRATIGFGLFTAGIVASFAAIGIASLKSFADTEQQIRRTAAVLGTDVFSKIAANGGTAEEAFAGFRREVEGTNKALSDTVNSVAVGTIFDPTEIASGTRALAQAGLTVEDIKGSLLGIAQFAQNEEILPEEAVNSLVQGATAAGESLADLTSLADKFTFVANNTTASAKEVADAFANRSAPQFRALGQDINDTLTVLNLFAAAGVKGKTAGEQAGILIRFVNQAASKNTEIFKKNRIEVGKVNGAQVPFLKTLGQLGFLLNSVGKAQGSVARTKLQKQLGLTEKSAAGLNQLLPQIVNGLDGTADSSDEAVRGLFNLKAQIDKADIGEGATQRQASILLDTLSFQTDILANNITTLFKVAAGPLGKALTNVFSELNGEVKIVDGKVTQVGGVLKGLGDRFLDTGKKLAAAIAPAVKAFAIGGEGATFFNGLAKTFSGTLTGLRDGFVAFRREAFGEGSDKGFFTVMGEGFAAIGRFSASVLPKIGTVLGKLTSFIKENTLAVELFIKAWLGVFLISKALRLLIIPIVGITDNLHLMRGGLVAAGAVKFGGLIAQLVGVKKAADAAKVATASVATAQAGAGAVATGAATRAGTSAATSGAAAGAGAIAIPAVAGAAGGVSALLAQIPKLGPLLTKALVSPIIIALKYGKLLVAAVLGLPAAIAALPGAIAGFVKGLRASLRIMSVTGGGGFLGFFKSLKEVAPALLRGSKLFSKFLGPIGLVILAIELAIGAVKGFISGLKEQIDTTGAAGEGLKTIGNILKVVGDILGVVMDVGISLGKFFGRLVGQILTSMGQIVQGIKEVFSGNFIDGFKLIGVGLANALTAPLRFAVSFVIDLVADLFNALGKVPGMGWARDAADAIHGTADAVADFKFELDDSTESTKKAKSASDQLNVTTRQAAVLASQAAIQHRLAGNIARLSFMVQKQEADRAAAAQRRSVVFIDTTKKASNDLLTAVGAFQPAFAKYDAQSSAAFRNAASASNIATSQMLTHQSTLQASLGQTANAMNSMIEAELVKQLADAQAGIGSSTVLGARRRLNAFRQSESDAKMIAAAKKARRDMNVVAEALGETTVVNTEATEANTAATVEAKTAAELAEEAINKLTVAQFKNSAEKLINRIAKFPGAYKATAYEAGLLAKAMPSIDKAIEKQTGLVTKLDEALQKLQGTQLLGTKAASDEAFASEQEVKKLELQKLDLKIAGAVDDDPAVKAIDEQIAAIQIRAERAALAASIGLDPLKKKLEDTFNPVKELSFDAIIKQFTSLNAARERAQGSLTKTEALKAALDKVVAASADKFADVGLSVSQGIVAGTTAGKPAVAKAGKDTANTLVSTTKKALGIASPSTVMATIGLQSSQGYAQGILSGRPAVVTSSNSIRIAAVNSLLTGVPFFRAAGVRSLAGFKEGMQSVWKTSGSWGNSLQDFVLGIATWIQKHKGPISYDAQLLRPAGEAIMSGFKRGLNDGFGEIKGWVSSVGPTISDTFPKELMFERSARFLLNNVKADTTFDPNDAFSDLLADSYTPGGEGPSGLSFLHKTKSYADTMKMAEMIAKKYGMSITGRGEAAGHVVGSQHPLGQAADISNSAGSDWNRSSRTPEMERMKSDLLPYLSKYLHQVIYAEKIYGSGGGPTGAGGSITNSNPHNAHVHVGWQPDSDFSRNSGKLGSYGLDIPGVPQDVMEAINYAAEKTKLDARLIAAVMKQESGYRKDVVSFDGGYGLMQLTSAGLVAEAKSMGSIFDPKVNTLVGAKYLSDLINQLGSRKLGLSAYNSGPGGGERYGRVDVPDYVRKVLAHLDEIIRKTGGSGIGGFRAMGGNVNAKTPYMVGERGREVFIPDRSGTVISNANVEGLIRMAQEGRMTGGTGTIINDNRVNHIQSNATDNAAVAALLDAKLRAQLVGVRR